MSSMESSLESSLESSFDSTKRVFRVKRKVNEMKSKPNKRCKYIGSIESNDDKDIHQLLKSIQTSPQKELEEEQNSIRLNIIDFEDKQFDHKIDSTKVITCNEQPLETVENELSETNDYIYDIYTDDNKENDENDYREECDDCESEVSSNDENHPNNDYPDDYDNNQLTNSLNRTTISSDYNLNDEEKGETYLKNISSGDEDEDEDEDE